MARQGNLSGGLRNPTASLARMTPSRMALTDIDIDAITEADLAAAIASGLRQGSRIAFAPEAYRHPFVKDISSLANSEGGLMLIGIAEKDGIAKGFVPLTGNSDTELRQLAERMRDGITPPVPGVRLRAIQLAGGGIVAVLHVPPSKAPPHRVASPRDPRSTLVYVRDNSGASELPTRALSDGWFD
jgi:predicted HTH transcriptional regulator